MSIALSLATAFALVGGIVAFLAHAAGGRMRSHVRVVANDMRTVGKALEAYRLDHGAYPPASPPIRKDLGDWGSILGLTTPVAYISSLFPDPYHPLPPGEPSTPMSRRISHLYYSTGDDYLLVSAGMDGVLEIRDPASLLADKSGVPLAVRLAPLAYDPTNGFGLQVIRGDLWLSGGTVSNSESSPGGSAVPITR